MFVLLYLISDLLVISQGMNCIAVFNQVYQSFSYIITPGEFGGMFTACKKGDGCRKYLLKKSSKSFSCPWRTQPSWFCTIKMIDVFVFRFNIILQLNNQTNWGHIGLQAKILHLSEPKLGAVT